MDKERQRKQARLRMQKKRNIERNKMVQNVTQDDKNVTRDVTQIRPIILALADSVKREKLHRICASLEKHNVLDKEIYYGCGGDPILMSEVSELLTAFD